MAIDTAETQSAAPEYEMEKPQAEHEWLQKFVGEWESVTEMSCGPTGEPVKATGTMSIRSIGGFFIHGEATGVMPDGDSMISFMTLGFDAQAGKYVGTWFGSMMTKLWVYDATREGEKLILASEGPSFEAPGKTTMYHDIVELVDDNHHTLTARFQGQDGNWNEMMKTDYYRKA
ncbi:MAG: DUF1579 domain-containing protein [Chloroflexi bacterium]|nr:DUF1579 domain-containing protein [Chloroflexota bacterium]